MIGRLHDLAVLNWSAAGLAHADHRHREWLNLGGLRLVRIWHRYSLLNVPPRMRRITLGKSENSAPPNASMAKNTARNTSRAPGGFFTNAQSLWFVSTSCICQRNTTKNTNVAPVVVPITTF